MRRPVPESGGRAGCDGDGAGGCEGGGWDGGGVDGGAVVVVVDASGGTCAVDVAAGMATTSAAVAVAAASRRRSMRRRFPLRPRRNLAPLVYSTVLPASFQALMPPSRWATFS